MADLKIAVSPPALIPGARTASPRTEAVRAAQRAFFDTALAGEPAAAPAGPARVEATSPRPAPEVRAAIDPAAPPPARPLRPGSLLDIKV